ncbi:MAG: class I SAM-dependent methyltransferase [Acidimicrobiia bacterium]
MLTVDYRRLGVRRDDVVLDVGAGLGRHAYEAARHGARVVVADLSDADMKDVRAVLLAMADDEEIERGALVATMAADATTLPFGDATIDRIIASEVCEHIDDDRAAFAEFARVLKPGGRLAVTVPSFVPEKVCWAITDTYHAPKVPGGHVRIYRRRDVLARMRAAGLVPVDAHRAHALHSPYWWLKCAVGLQNDDNKAVTAYRKLLEWDIMKRPALTRYAERTLNPLLGKSLVVYADKPSA